MSENKEVLIKIEDVKKYFNASNAFGNKKGQVHAVDDINLDIYKGETLGLVGESGCGKSTLGRTILRLTDATDGTIYFKDQDINKLKREPLRQMRKHMQMIFQDPYSSLNPRMTVMEIIRSPLDAFNIGTKEERDQKVLEIMEKVGLGKQFLFRYPHEFSGGQRQRVVIAKALILNPDFVVADEPVSALDVSVRSQILNLMKELQEELDFTCLFISHDLSVVKHISNRVAVMYLGKIVELADKNELYDNPLHPYTKALLSAIPIPDATVKVKRQILSGDVPSPYDPPSGCHFHTRCPYATERCSTECPKLKDMGDGHFVACHLCEGGAS
ncbi:MAG TPA: ATP-binding cassette domain-containing protein [Candidatus Avilachnospira avistercoris]|nr:ATP-binding cassette domain-containing protein [Candidatus Avilachnospira avistercoris]